MLAFPSKIILWVLTSASIDAVCGAFVVVRIPALRQRSTTSPRNQRILAKKKNKSNAKRNKGPGKGFGRGAVTKEGFDSSAIEEGAAKHQSGTGTTSGPIHTKLLSWLRRHPNTHISAKFTIAPSPLGGYGGFATAALRKNEVLFRIPRECCVTYDDALSDPDIGGVFQQIKRDRLPSWGMILIAGWIAKEYMLANDFGCASSVEGVGADVGGRNSNRIKHLPYLQSIPWERGSFGQDHILFWSDEEVETLLKESLAYDDATLIRKTVESTIQLLGDFVIPIVRNIRLQSQNHDHTTINSDGDESCDDSSRADIMNTFERAIKGAFVIALSRSFAEEVEDDEGTVEVENVLLPLIDMLQHNNAPNTELEPYDDFVIVRARRDVDAGEELFHQYQEENDNVIPPHKFFTRYGFIPGVREPTIDLLKRRDSIFFDFI